MKAAKIGPRNSCKAIIINGNNELLTVQKRDQDEIYFVLPGGGQRHGETFIETIKRECREEIGGEPKVHEEILFIREYIGKHHMFPHKHTHVHQIEYMFLCEIGTAELGKGTEWDKGQGGIVWIKIDELHTCNFYPKKLIPEIEKYSKGEHSKIYLGDIN